MQYRVTNGPDRNGISTMAYQTQAATWLDLPDVVQGILEAAERQPHYWCRNGVRLPSDRAQLLWSLYYGRQQDAQHALDQIPRKMRGHYTRQEPLRCGPHNWRVDVLRK